MPNFIQLPADLPWWAALAILVPVAIYALLLLAMPFSVFGLKSRLDQIEGQLGDIREELQAIAARLPARGQAPPANLRAAQTAPEHMPEAARPVRAEREAEPAPRPRAEPRLDWRR
ncbi:MAG: hypothetical protein P4L66_06560 [Acetobacteraceae bacterium]|nr:hypothetical protein [Acetobacteraceae bacterium]